MGENNYQQKLYKSLGVELKNIRLRLRQSIAEVSGSVEVDVEVLAKYENGEARPDEEILLLLISHFDLSDDTAAKLWNLAGYDKEDASMQSFADNTQQAGAFVLPQDARVIYTDVTHASANRHGAVINFMQSAGPMGKPMIVSRVGMSREHAQNLLELLQSILHQPEQTQRLLEAPKDNKDNKDNLKNK
jgi:transcriptional regulator with XRE-family HTH domain